MKTFFCSWRDADQVVPTPRAARPAIAGRNHRDTAAFSVQDALLGPLSVITKVDEPSRRAAQRIAGIMAFAQADRQTTMCTRRVRFVCFKTMRTRSISTISCPPQPSRALTAADAIPDVAMAAS
jgi:hypothetical protein